MNLEKYECDGQLTFTDYFANNVKSGKVKGLTEWINSSGIAQYSQIKKVIEKSYEANKDSDELIGRLVNDVSVWVLGVSIGYMEYLKGEME